VHAHLFAELLVVACAESADRRVKDATELASGVIVVEDVVGRIFTILPFTVSAFYHMYAIVLAVKQRINVRH
jgi:hypothetical protein